MPATIRIASVSVFPRICLWLQAKEVNERLCTVMRLQDENAILGLLIKKIGMNLQKRFRMEQVRCVAGERYNSNTVEGTVGLRLKSLNLFEIFPPKMHLP